jgi:hypothetical protein
MVMTPNAVHAMLTGMVIMVLPALAICLGITVMAFRRRDQSPRNGTGRGPDHGRSL